MTLVAKVALPVGIADLMARTATLTGEFGEGLVAIQYDDATLGIFTPAEVIGCPTCGLSLDGEHVNHATSKPKG